MRIKNILVSQPAPAIPDRSPFNDIIKKYGAKVEFFPFIKVEGVSLREFRSQRVEILDHTVILFSSRTTIDHFFRICDEARITIPETMKYLCNTEAVALYLQKYIVYRKRKIFFADGSFSGFMDLILKHRDQRMLLTLSEPYKADMATVMERMKINFNKVVFSRAVSRDLSGVNPAEWDLMVFYSAAEISALKAAFDTASLPMIATFGASTARAAIEAGIPVRTMAPTPEVPSMAKAIDIFISKINAGETLPPVEVEASNQVDEYLKVQEAKPAKKSRVKRAVTAAPPARSAAKLPAPATRARATAAKK